MFLKKREHIVITIFFVGYFLIGLAIYDDYGLAYDEPSIRHVGEINLNYILHGDKTLFQDKDRYYSPFFEILLVALERVFHIEDSRQIYLMRHLVTFLLFYISVFVFYLLCKQRFDDWKLGLLGTVFLILSPRIFAHSFFNSKDLPFLSIFIIGIYTLVTYLERPSWGTLSFHALVCAILVCVRILGVFVPCLTLFFLVGTRLFGKTEIRSFKLTFLSMLHYLIILIIFVRLFFPMLWQDGFYHFRQAFAHMQHYPWTLDVLYMGEYIKASELPWHYIPVWMSLTTPFFYIVLFCIGMLAAFASWVKKPFSLFSDSQVRNDMLFLLWFLLPLLAVIVLKSVLYDGWRHLYFIYPAFVLLAVRGGNILFSFFKKRRSRLINALLAVLIIVGLAEPLSFMILNHPYQNLYFNHLAGLDSKQVAQRFEMDYWGLSYTQALNFLVEHDPNPYIKVVLAKFPIRFCNGMVPASDRKRILCSKYINGATYFLGNFRSNREGYPCDDEIYSISVNDMKIVAVYKADSCKPGRY